MKNRHFLVYSISFLIFAFVRVTRISKAMQTTAIGTVVNSLPENKVILLTLLISKRYIPYTDLRKISFQQRGIFPIQIYGKFPFNLASLPLFTHRRIKFNFLSR